MAHGWDSYFHNLPSLSTDPSTLPKTTESQGSLSHHIENFIGHHDFPGTDASHEAPTTNSNFSTNYYSNPSIGNSTTNCVYRRHYKETPWQGDGDQNEKDYLPRCSNGDLDFATDGLTTTESFPSALVTDLQGLKQDCGMLATSFLEAYSDVSSCSDADIGDTRPSCQFIASNSVPKPKTDVVIKQSSSEWLFTDTGNITFPTESPNMSETNAILPSPSNVKAGENIVECAQEEMESPESTGKIHAGHNQCSTTFNVVVTRGCDKNDSCDQKQMEDVEQDLSQGRYSNISASNHKKQTGGRIEESPDGKREEQITATALSIMTTVDNEQTHLDEKVLRKEMNESFDQENEGFDNPDSTDCQDRNMGVDEHNKSQVLQGEIKDSGFLENDNFAKQISSNSSSTDGQNENLEIDTQEKDIQSNIFQSSNPPGIKESDVPRELRECTSPLKSNSFNIESSLQLIEHQSQKSVAQDNICLSPAVMSDSPFSETSEKKSVESQSKSCIDPINSNTGINPCEEVWSTVKTTTTTLDPGCNDLGLISDHLCVDISNKNEQGIASHLKVVMQPNSLSTGINPCPEKKIRSSQEKKTTTPSQDEQQLQHQSLVALELKSLSGVIAENARESFQELATSTEEPSMPDALYGEPLSREESSCDTDESQYKDTTMVECDDNTMNHSEEIAPQLKSSTQMKHLQPVVILKTLDSELGMSNSFRCGSCQYTAHNVDHLIEHHHCSHPVYNFRFCKTCNVYLMKSEQTDKHLCGITKENHKLPSESNPQKKRRQHGRHRCIKCGLIFSKLYQYIKHMRIHTGKTPFLCNGCGLYFAQAGTLQRHKRIPGRCKQTKFAVRNSDSVISETKTLPQKDTVQNKPPANLPECFVKLVDISKTNLWSVCTKSVLVAESKKHLYNEHEGKNLADSPSQCTTKLGGEKSQRIENEQKGKYKCPLCPRLFKYSYNRARHLRDCVRDSIYGGKGKVAGKYRCPLCHTCFTLSSNRYRHIRAFCLRECLNRLAKERAKSKQKTEQDKIKESQQKILSKETEQKNQAPPNTTVFKAVPRYKCNLCPAVFCYASGKYRHMKKHELFKLTGKMFRYRNSVFAIMHKPTNLCNTEEDKLNTTKANNSLALNCHFCGKCFSTSQSLQKHERSHRGEKPYHCLECGRGFKKRAHLIGHKIVHQKRIQCTVCRKILSSIGELIQHRSSHLKRGKLQCPDCHLQFQYPAHLLRHLDVHKNKENKASQLDKRPQIRPQQSLESVRDQSGPKDLQCSLCKEVFHDAQVLRKHCLTHISGSSSNQCPFCKHHFSNRRYLLRHMIKHTGDKPFSCSNCGKQFYRDLYLKLHSEKCLPVQSRHSVIMESDTKSKGAHRCVYCPRVFFKKIRLKNHHRGHMTNSLLLCSRCGQYFGFRKLNQHQKNCVGTELKTGLSSPNGDISKRTSQTSQIVCNMALQTNATKMLPFKCPYCIQQFRYRSLLLRHLVSHTGVQPYACVHCGHRFSSRTMCLQHEAFCDGVYKEGQSKVNSEVAKQLTNAPALREATQKPQAQGEAEYKCKFCTKTFLKSRNLRRHILTHNEVKPYRCKTCESCFSRYDHLKVHQTRCRGKSSRLEVCIPKISLDDIGKGWKNRFAIESTEKEETFECKVCLRSFSSQSKLSRHSTMFHVTKLFKCICGSSFAHEKSLKKHRKMKKCRKVSNEKNALPVAFNLPTENVTKSLDGVRNRVLQRIQPYFNKKYKYICSYCPRAFGNSWQLGVHTRLHTGERPYLCDSCGQRFIRKDYLQRHFPKCPKKSPQNKTLCDTCGGLFLQVELENHKKSCTLTPGFSKSTVCQSQQSTSQSPPKGYSCAYCSSRFLLFSQLQEHFLSAHKMETMVPPVSTAPLQHHLSNIPNIKEEPLDESCEKQFRDDANLTALEREVPKSFSCPECNMSFLSKAGLTGHLRVHTMAHPFNCKTCKRGFWNKSLLRNHYRKCRNGRISEGNTSQQVEVPLKAEIDFALNDSVLVFEEGSKTTGMGVLQTNFSHKEDESKQNSDGNEVQGSAMKEKKVEQYQCSECDKSFTDGLMLISHLEDHGRQEQEKKRNTCTKCGRVCSSQGNLEKHLKMHGIVKKYSCPDCSKMFYTLSDVEIHRTYHDANRPYACKLCNQRFWTRQSLCNHYSEAHPNDVFTCRFCNKTYSVKKSLARHYRKWHQEEQKIHGSNVQGKSRTEQESSSQVGTTGESDEDENNSTEDSDSDSAPYFPCHVCGKTFPTSENLEDHQRCHLGEKPHECAECGRCFYQASQLQQHQRMHKSEFQCQACGRGFVSLFALRKHKHTHGKSRPYRCSKCHLSFTGPSQLSEHMSTHREENFPCDICNCVFRSKSSRAEHWKSHSKSGECHPPSVSNEEQTKSASLSDSSSVFNKELKYRCGACSERFSDPEKLSEHGCIAAKERPYSCSDCDRHFLHASHLKKHRTTHQLSLSHSEYPCSQCNNSFSSSQHFLSHLESHNDTATDIKCYTEGEDGGFICPICHQCFASATQLIGHFSNHLDGKFECKICKMTFSSGVKLEQHESCHLTSATEFECAECAQSILGRDAFHQHHCSHQQHSKMLNKYSDASAKTSPQTYHQSLGEEEEIDVTGEDLYNCPICSMQFSSKSSLLEHQNKQHPNEKPFRCELCGKTFALRRYLRKHEQRHCQKSASHSKAQSTENKLKCTQCRNEFSTAQDLSLHMRLHAEKEVGEYRCDMCYKSFSQWSHLKQHQESHVGQVVYECTECDKAFAFPHLLEEHQQTHALSSQ